MLKDNKKISDKVLDILWDKWKICNSNVYNRYNRFWTIQLAAFGWIMFVLRGGISSFEALSCFIILVSISLVGLHFVSLMKIDLKVRNIHNPEVIQGLSERGLFHESISVDIKKDNWTPNDLGHKWNNWHSCRPESLMMEKSEVETPSAAERSIKVVICLCILNGFLALMFLLFKLIMLLNCCLTKVSS